MSFLFIFTTKICSTQHVEFLYLPPIIGEVAMEQVAVHFAPEPTFLPFVLNLTLMSPWLSQTEGPLDFLNLNIAFYIALILIILIIQYFYIYLLYDPVSFEISRKSPLPSLKVEHEKVSCWQVDNFLYSSWQSTLFEYFFLNCVANLELESLPKLMVLLLDPVGQK